MYIILRWGVVEQFVPFWIEDRPLCEGSMSLPAPLDNLTI